MSKLQADTPRVAPPGCSTKQEEEEVEEANEEADMRLPANKADHMQQGLNEFDLRLLLFMLDLKTTHSRRQSCCTTSCWTRGVAVAVRAINGTLGYLYTAACNSSCSCSRQYYKQGP